MIKPSNDIYPKICIKVVGVGGAGGNAINTMIESGIEGVEFVAINTDLQDLDKSLATHKIHIGKNITRGLGTGMNPECGQEAALEDKDEILSVLNGSDMIFIAAGMGGGTGTGAAPVIAELARSLDAITVSVVTKPFSFEGLKRQKIAEEGCEKLKKASNTIISIRNDKLMQMINERTNVRDAFKIVDSVLLNATKGITNIIFQTGYINLDFADVKTILENGGDALMGLGVASGENRAVICAQQALSSELLDGVSIAGAKDVLVNVSGNSTLFETQDICKIIQEHSGHNTNVFYGLNDIDSKSNEIRLTVIATGFSEQSLRQKDIRKNTINDIKIKHTVIDPVKEEIANILNLTDDSPESNIIKHSANLAKIKTTPNQITINLDDSNQVIKDNDLPKKTLNVDLKIVNEKNNNLISKKNLNHLHDDFDADLEIPTYIRKSMD